MDISMPRMDGIEATKQICGICPHTQIVMLTIYNSAEHVQRALRAGAAGYVLKDAAGQELVAAVRALHKGGHYYSPQIDGRH
jgi:DNA-binding NarL/FixJ family response regulator